MGLRREQLSEAGQQAVRPAALSGMTTWGPEVAGAGKCGAPYSDPTWPARYHGGLPGIPSIGAAVLSRPREEQQQGLFEQHREVYETAVREP